jgi:hypothetical protein
MYLTRTSNDVILNATHELVEKAAIITRYGFDTAGSLISSVWFVRKKHALGGIEIGKNTAQSL